MPQRLTSSLAACVWIPLFPLRCEEARREGLVTHPSALLAPDLSRKLWQVSPLARHTGVRPGMTVSQAIGLCPTLRLCEPDPVHYDGCFSRLLSALNEVSPVVEPGELGLAYLGADGLEGIYGSPGKIVEAIECVVRGEWCVRLGWGRGKFAAWVAASRAKPGEPVIVPSGGEGKYLAAQPIAVLPLDPDTHRRLRQLGIRTLGALAALPEEAVTAQFGAVGRRLWRLAAGRTVEPVVGNIAPEPIVAALTFFTPVGERDLIERAIDQLIARALKDPRRIGWRVQAVRLVAEVEGGRSSDRRRRAHRRSTPNATRAGATRRRGHATRPRAHRVRAGDHRAPALRARRRRRRARGPAARARECRARNPTAPQAHLSLSRH